MNNTNENKTILALLRALLEKKEPTQPPPLKQWFQHWFGGRVEPLDDVQPWAIW